MNTVTDYHLHILTAWQVDLIVFTVTAVEVHNYITSHTEGPMMRSVECVNQMLYETNTRWKHTLRYTLDVARKTVGTANAGV